MFSKVYQAALLAAAATSTASAAASLKDIKHIVLFMQENRAFDHYYGTMAGVRGFGDPNAHVYSDGKTTFQQPLSSTQNGVDILQPWHATYKGGDYLESTQCMTAGSNGWDALHSAYAGGQLNNWVQADYANSMAYFTRSDIPTHFDIVEGWTLLDMNMQAVLSSTNPNRVWWMSGTVNAPGSPSNPDGDGSIMISNAASPGCDSPKLNCYPYDWRTFAEYLEDAGVSWKVWQDDDNFEDNMLAYYKQYQEADEGSPLQTKGNSYPGLDNFYAAAANGTLPQVSYIVGPQEQAEHPPNMPIDGAWLQKQVVDAVTSSPAYNETVLIISYDEQGGWADHVVPIVSPKDTPGEWITDPYGQFGDVPIGPGPRVPRYIISPYTRGGNVFTEISDHSSDIKFVEAWAEANGFKDVYSKELSPWRRQVMSDLTNAFDWENPDYTIPSITDVRKPESSTPPSSCDKTLGCLSGPWVGPSRCEADYGSNAAPPVPYGKENAEQNMTALVEEGFKPVRGQLTEGRYLTFEMGSLALANPDGKAASAAPASEKHEDVRQRWYVETVGDVGQSDEFRIRSAADGQYIAGGSSVGSLTEDADSAASFTFKYQASGSTYAIVADGQGEGISLSTDSKCRRRDAAGHVTWSGATAGAFKIFSVSYL